MLLFYSRRQSPVEWNISSFTKLKNLFHHRNDKHSLFVLYNLNKDKNFQMNFTKTSNEKMT